MNIHNDTKAVVTTKMVIHRLPVRVLTLHEKKSCTEVAMIAWMWKISIYSRLLTYAAGCRTHHHSRVCITMVEC